jgi:hypothetical protein
MKKLVNVSLKKFKKKKSKFRNVAKLTKSTYPNRNLQKKRNKRTLTFVKKKNNKKIPKLLPSKFRPGPVLRRSGPTKTKMKRTLVR